MCGRYASFLPAEALRALFQTVNPTPNWESTWNMAPTRDAPVVRLHPETRARHLDLLRWGLVPLWAKEVAFGHHSRSGGRIIRTVVVARLARVLL